MKKKIWILKLHLLINVARMIYDLKLSRNIQIHFYFCCATRQEKSSLYYRTKAVHELPKQNKWLCFIRILGLWWLSVFSTSQKIVFHGMKWNKTVLHLPWSRSHFFVATIFLFELLRLFNSRFALFQIINTVQEIGDQAKKPSLNNFPPTH